MRINEVLFWLILALKRTPWPIEYRRRGQKAQGDKEESGLGFSLEQLEFNCGKPENAAGMQ